jgi:hypothetical protein
MFLFMANEYGQDFKIIVTPAEAKARAELSELLANEGGKPDRTADRVIDLLAARVRTIIAESNYIDIDYKASFGRLYFTRHRDIDRRCTRIHFFGAEVQDEDLLDLTADLKDQYLGFLVRRPLPAFRLGRTVLAEGLIHTAPSAVSDGQHRYVTCKAKYSVNLAGNQIRFTGCPWIQQDTMVSACASASAWVCGWHAAHRFGPDFKLFTTPEITDLASQFNIDTGRSMPSEGLTVEQMLIALKGMGFAPLIRFPATADEGKRLCYAYVESSVPVIAVLSSANVRVAHAVTVVGHTFDLQRPESREPVSWGATTLTFCRSTDFVPRFVVQDDSGGPFRFMSLLSWPEAVTAGRVNDHEVQALRARHRCPVLLDEGTPYQKALFLRSFLIPLPKRVTFDAINVEQQARLLITRWYSSQLHQAPETISTRTFLLPSNALKTWWRPGPDRPVEIAEEIRRHLMSKWVWLTEYSDLQRLRSNQPPVLGQVIQDSAGHGKAISFFDLLAFTTPISVELGRPDGNFVGKAFEACEPYPQCESESA